MKSMTWSARAGAVCLVAGSVGQFAQYVVTPVRQADSATKHVASAAAHLFTPAGLDLARSPDLADDPGHGLRRDGGRRGALAAGNARDRARRADQPRVLPGNGRAGGTDSLWGLVCQGVGGGALVRPGPPRVKGAARPCGTGCAGP